MWNKIHTHFDDWGHPLRPGPEVVEIFEQMLQPYKKRLLLGLTKELIPLCTEHADLVSNGIDWFNLPFEKQSFDAIYGDGVFIVAGPKIKDAVMPFIRPGGAFIARIFLHNTSQKISDNIDIRKFQHWNKKHIPVTEILERYGEYPTTRDYRDSSDIYYLPELSDLDNYSEISYPSWEYGEFFPVVKWIA